MPEKFNVGGLELDRPFLIRRLGHFGFNVVNYDGLLTFLIDHLGFIFSDMGDLREVPLFDNMDETVDTRFFFLRYGTEHHAIVLVAADAAERGAEVLGPYTPDTSLNQLTWQVGSLAEVVNAVPWLDKQSVSIVRSGRDMPGSNYHSYFTDPDGRVNELYFGMEQIGWDGLSKPPELYRFGSQTRVPLPQPCDAAEVDSIRGTPTMWSGYVGRATGEPKYEVDGIMLPRPFKVVGMGPVKLFCADMDKALHFYRDVLGFVVTSTATVHGHECAFLRSSSDHHMVALLPIALRAALGLRGNDNLFSMGIRLANYRQLRDARAYFSELGYAEVELPAELSPGVEHCFTIRDPDDHLFQFYWSMEQIGWDGVARTGTETLYPRQDWPETLPPRADSHRGEPFLMPWE